MNRLVPRSGPGPLAVAALSVAALALWFGMAAGGTLQAPPRTSDPASRGAGVTPATAPGASPPDQADASTPPTLDPSGPRSLGRTPIPDGQPGGAAPSTVPFQLDTAVGWDLQPPAALPTRVELYAGEVSVLPGEPLELHVSTPAATYRYTISRVDATRATGAETVYSSGSRPGHDNRSLATFDSLTRTARANWPVTDDVDTSGWTPGVYIASATDAAGSQGQAIFVVRTAVLAPDAPAFVFTALTYQAYNLWGGANLYSYASPPATRVSFERPYDQAGGRGFWTKYDDRILAWLQRQHLPLQYTTDYDLAAAPPEPAPRLVILPQHAEYVPRPLRDWVDRHVNQLGDMGLLSFGANGFYWQVRLAAPRTPGAPADLICFKDPNADPAAAMAPTLTTTRWRDAPVDQPEGELLGSQYVGILGDAHTRYDLRVTASAPRELLAGTGWSPGTIVKGVLLGEGDGTDASAGGITVLQGQAKDPGGTPILPGVTIRSSPAGARLFLAGSFAWIDGLSPARVSLGVTQASFERFNRNVLAWLGYPGPG